MALFSFLSKKPSLSRRRFLQGSIYAAGGLALYSGEIARHWVEVTERDIHLAGLPQAFDGMRVVQLSDIHLDEYTEPYFLHTVVERINNLQPDIVLLTGDFVSDQVASKNFARKAAWQCAAILKDLPIGKVYSVLGNHDLGVDAREVTNALQSNGIPVLRNASLPIQRGNSRIWLAGFDDPVVGHPNPDKAIPPAIRNLPTEPIILMCHAPDYADTLRKHPAGSSVGLMLSGHTHGGQVRLPFLGALELPELGKNYVEGWFQVGAMQLYVNRGIGTIGLPFRLNCPPEITALTLRTA